LHEDAGDLFVAMRIWMIFLTETQAITNAKQQEKDYIKMLSDQELKTRLMYFDLLRIA
jgi:hypothetical protein